MSSLTVSCLLVVCALHHVGARVAGVAGNYTIIGGHAIPITDAPFMAALTLSGQSLVCGASIVDRQFLLSASHCYSAASKYHVIVGTDNINSGQKYEIEKFFPHPNYNPKTMDNDILVIKLKKQLTFSNRVQPIKLADPYLVIRDGEMLDTMGFGQTEHAHISEQLLKVDVPYFPQEKCIAFFKSKGINTITERVMCAGGEAGRDSCYGDSGGPLRYKDQLVGIVSWGHECGVKGYPAVYTRVSTHRSFIESVMKNN